jgi:hypothetical protein
MEFKYFKKSASVRKIEASNKQKASHLLEKGYIEMVIIKGELKPKGKKDNQQIITLNNKIEELKAEIIKLKSTETTK